MSKNQGVPDTDLDSDLGLAIETCDNQKIDTELCDHIRQLFFHWSSCLCVSRERFYSLKSFISKSYLAKLDYYNSSAVGLKELKQNDKFFSVLKVNEQKRLKKVSDQVKALKKLWIRCCKSFDTIGARLTSLELDKAKFELNLNKMSMKGRAKWPRLQSLVRKNRRSNRDRKVPGISELPQSLEKLTLSPVSLRLEKIYEKKKTQLANFESDFLTEIENLCNWYNQIESGQDDHEINDLQVVPRVSEKLEIDDEWFKWEGMKNFKLPSKRSNDSFDPFDGVSYHGDNTHVRFKDIQQKDAEKSPSTPQCLKEPEGLAKAILGQKRASRQIKQESWDILKSSWSKTKKNLFLFAHCISWCFFLVLGTDWVERTLTGSLENSGVICVRTFEGKWEKARIVELDTVNNQVKVKFEDARKGFDWYPISYQLLSKHG